MATFHDVVKELIEKTESGALEWKVATDSGGYWHSICDGMHFQVRRSSLVEVYGNVPSIGLGKSPDLLEVLQQKKPLELEVTRDEVLQRALECLQGSEKD